MKTTAEHKPVSRAIENFEELIRRYSGKRNQALPTETELARKWGLSSSAVNRASHQLIGARKLRRDGYKLFANDAHAESITGARVMYIAHRSARVSGMIEEAARRGMEIKEASVMGSDSMRRHLHEAIRTHVDGVIMRLADSGWEWDAEMAELDRLNIPCVVGEESVPNVSIAAEDIDGAARMLAEHLIDLGHTKIACLGSLRRPIRSSMICRAFEETMLRHRLADSAKMQVLASSHTREGMAGALRKIRTLMPDVTAVILFDIDILHAFLQTTRSARISIPNDLSLCTVGDSIDARTNEPSITCANFDSKMLMHTALDILCRQIASVRQWGRILQRPRVKIEATLRRGGSVRNLGTPAEILPKPVQSIAKYVWPKTRTERVRAVEQTWLDPHELAGAAWTGDFIQMDLRGVANRSLHRPHGWLGHLPLQNLAPGIRHIHGVNFDLIDEAKNDGKAVLVMRSSRTLPGARNAIPSRIVLPIERKVKAVYFLHGCGFAADAVPFAWYEFVNAKKHDFNIPLVPLGLVDRLDAPDANIQDWWADFPQFDAAHVKHLVLAENGDPYEYERYLYTYEWLNPEPEIPLQTLTIKSNSDEPTTLGLLAITLLLAKQPDKP